MQGGVLRSYGAVTLLRKEKSLVLFSKSGCVVLNSCAAHKFQRLPRAAAAGKTLRRPHLVYSTDLGRSVDLDGVDHARRAAGASGCGNHGGRSHFAGRIQEPHFRSRRAAATTLWDGNLLRVPGRGRWTTPPAHLPDCLPRWNGDHHSMSARVDLLVVGAGPGGLVAAATAAEAGMRVCIVDDNPSAGGQIWRGGINAPDPNAARLEHRLKAAQVEMLRRLARDRRACGGRASHRAGGRMLRHRI